jgi:hypothetical protein
LGALAVFTRVVDALGRAAFVVGFAGFFELFFFGELAIISVSPWLAGRKRRLN